MIDIAILRAMAAAGATVDMILAAIEAAQAKETVRAADRRAKEAERQKRYRLSRVLTRTNAESPVVTGCPRDNRDIGLNHSSINGNRVGQLDEHIDNTLTKSIKKESKRSISAAIDVPEDASEDNRTFAKSKGWDDRKTASEWQRFRDHSLSKGKKHRNVDAAWRNWVTSPFQAQTGNTPDERSVLKAADRQLDQFGGRAAAANYVPGSSGPRPLSLDYGDEPPSPKLISSR